MYLHLTLNLIRNVQKDHCTLFKQHLPKTWPVVKKVTKPQPATPVFFFQSFSTLGLSVGLAGTIGWLGTCGFCRLAELHLVVFEKTWHEITDEITWNYDMKLLAISRLQTLVLIVLIKASCFMGSLLQDDWSNYVYSKSSQPLKSSHTFSELGSWNDKNRALEISAMERGDLESINTDPGPSASKKVAEVCGWLWW